MYLGHKSVDGREQVLSEHLRNTAELAGEFADSFHCRDWGYACGLMHDIGKYSAEFQKRIRGENHHVDHSTAGAVEMKNNKCFPAAYCIAGHHAGLPDGGYAADDSTRATLQGRLKKRIPDYSAFREEIGQVSLKSPAMKVLDKKEGAFAMTFSSGQTFGLQAGADDHRLTM